MAPLNLLLLLLLLLCWWLGRDPGHMLAVSGDELLAKLVKYTDDLMQVIISQLIIALCSCLASLSSLRGPHINVWLDEQPRNIVLRHPKAGRYSTSLPA
jgi:hypothetical protein